METSAPPLGVRGLLQDETISFNSSEEQQQQHDEEEEEEEEEGGGGGGGAPCGDPTRDHETSTTDSSTALKLFLDRIPITSIPSIENPPSKVAVAELKPDDCVRDAIRLLCEKNASAAVIVDSARSGEIGGFRDREMGLIHLSNMLLWCLQEMDKEISSSGSGSIFCGGNGFLDVLDQISHVGQTKVTELAKSFIWEPFFPVNSDATLLQVLLLLAKHHRLKVVPVTGLSSCPPVSGYVTQNDVVHMLLQSRGLEWFDKIADKALTEFRFKNSRNVICVYGDQSLADGLHCLRANQVDAVQVIDSENRKLIGSLRSDEVRLLLDDNGFFNNRKNLALEEFIRSTTETKEEVKNGGHCALAVNQETDTLKQAMENMASSNSDCTFVLNGAGQVVGTVTLRDTIMQFSPPASDSAIGGVGFFKSALDQTGCRIEDGKMICDH